MTNFSFSTQKKALFFIILVSLFVTAVVTFTQFFELSISRRSGAVETIIPSPTPFVEFAEYFEELPTPTLAMADETEPTLVRIPTISTVGWKSVTNNGVTFLIPPDARCSGSDDDCIGVVTSFIYEGRTIESNMIIAVEPYRGGSRRNQYIQDHEQSLVESCNPIFVDSVFGSVNALQIASYDCYGAGGITTVVGDKLVTFFALSYDPQTKEIERWPIRDTIISTLSI